MDQFKGEEDHKLSGQNIQWLEHAKLLVQDFEAFENFCFPPDSMDYNPNYQNANECIFYDELVGILNEGNRGEGGNGGGHGSNMVPVQMNNGVVMEELYEIQNEENSGESGNGGGHGSNMLPVQMNNGVVMEELYEIQNEENSGESGNGGGHGSNMVPVQMNNCVVMEATLKNEGHAKGYVKRKRYKKGSVEAARMMELKKIRNRETAARAFAQKKAYLEQLELNVTEFKKKNAHLKNLLLFGISSLSSGRAEKQLRRTASGPL